MAKILLGVCGSIAAFKAVDLASKLTQEGHLVRAILTQNAQKFISPLSLDYVCRQKAVLAQFSGADFRLEDDHIALADWADILVVAPATADILGKCACGIADDVLSTVALALDMRIPRLFAPAMNHRMYAHPLVQKNIRTLRELGYHILPTSSGHLACGHQGEGRLLEVPDILQSIERLLEEAENSIES
ncbi:MAG: hypothetical protein D6805_05525 [Planctomycetota bacterium]|nr:MAG: hypothetical protein D6805_05525 [Planctomycetota bacterium]